MADRLAGLRRIRWDIVLVVVFSTPVAVIVMALLVRLTLWAITGDGTWAGYSPIGGK